MRPFSLVGAGLAWLYARSLSLLTPDDPAMGRLAKHEKRASVIQKRELVILHGNLLYLFGAAVRPSPLRLESHRGCRVPQSPRVMLGAAAPLPPLPRSSDPRCGALAPAPQHPRSEALPRNLPPRSCNCDPSPNLYLSILLLEHQMSEATERRARHRAERSDLQERALVDLKFGQFNWGARSPVTEPSHGRAVGPF